MNFAKKELEKYGWKEGQGLGRNEDGISTAIKPKLKFDNAGLGHNAGEEFTNYWWEKVFNNASNNINVTINNGDVEVKVKNKKLTNITTNKYSLDTYNNEHLPREVHYPSFLRTSTLTSDGMQSPVKQSVMSEELPTLDTNVPFATLTDEQLFKACGGRTAHKGARHGLKLTGKLSRIEKQEKMLLKKMKNVSLTDDDKIVKKMQKLNLEKKKLKNEAEPVSEVNIEAEVPNTSTINLKKKKKKCRKSVSFNETVLEYYIATSDTSSTNENLQDQDNNNLQLERERSLDEGIEQDIEEDANANEDDHKSFEQPQFIVSDFSKAERRKLKKKRKSDEKETATSKFLQETLGESSTTKESFSFEKSKKRKLHLADANSSDSKRTQSETEFFDRFARKKEKRKKSKERKREEKQMKSIVKSMDSFCKIADDK